MSYIQEFLKDNLDKMGAATAPTITLEGMEDIPTTEEELETTLEMFHSDLNEMVTIADRLTHLDSLATTALEANDVGEHYLTLLKDNVNTVCSELGLEDFIDVNDADISVEKLKETAKKARSVIIEAFEKMYEKLVEFIKSKIKWLVSNVVDNNLKKFAEADFERKDGEVTVKLNSKDYQLRGGHAGADVIEAIEELIDITAAVVKVYMDVSAKVDKNFDIALDQTKAVGKVDRDEIVQDLLTKVWDPLDEEVTIGEYMYFFREGQLPGIIPIAVVEGMVYEVKVDFSKLEATQKLVKDFINSIGDFIDKHVEKSSTMRQKNLVKELRENDIKSEHGDLSDRIKLVKTSMTVLDKEILSMYTQVQRVMGRHIATLSQARVFVR